MSLFQSLKELIVDKISEVAPDLNVEELKNKAGEFLNVDGLSDKATELKDQVSESVNVEGLTDQVNESLDQGAEALNVDGVADQAKEATGNVTEKAQDFLSNLTDKFK
jgi:hypothetical protein